MPYNYTVQLHFNSRPHKEVDLNDLKQDYEYDISTHDLTRRSTAHLY